MTFNDAPRVKRKFQPDIRTFLSAPDDGAVTDENARSAHSAAKSYALPESIQSSLLSVGMRVRKAVPGGYRNAQLELAGKDENATSEPLAEMSTFQTNAPRELQPFCGLHKVGGLALPAEYSTPRARPVQQQLINGYLAPTIFTAKSLQPGKRMLEEAETEEQTSQMDWSLQVRPKARPSGRRQRQQRAVQSVDVVMRTQDDFEEAPFLMPRG